MALNLEPVYQEIFGKFMTRKKFVIRSVENNMLTVEQDEEICGQKEPKVFEEKNIEKDSTEETALVLTDEAKEEKSDLKTVFLHTRSLNL